MPAATHPCDDSREDEANPVARDCLSPRKSLSHDAAIRETLGEGWLVDDRAFDLLYPLSIRRASRAHWTPVEVAVRAAQLLADRPGLRIFDIGSGVGKFCVVAAASVDAVITGVEHRPHFVEIARRAACRVDVKVDFKLGTLDDVNPRDLDGVYLFNPFAENLSPIADQLDPSVELSEARFRRDVESTERLLHAAAVGTRVVTYCGWGGRMPSGYRLALREACVGTLELWIKTSQRDARRPSLPKKTRGVRT